MMRIGRVVILVLFYNTLGSSLQDKDTCRLSFVAHSSGSNPEICAYAVHPSSAVVSWRPSEPADVFRLTVYIDDDIGNLRIYTTEQFQGIKNVTKRYSVVVTDLQPWKYYVVSVEGVSLEHSSAVGNATFCTSPENVPPPIITRIEALGSSSFNVSWQFPQHDPRLFDGFRMVYGLNNEPSRFVVYTREHNLTVNGLKPDTTFDIEVAALYTYADGTPVLGAEGKASVTTWPKLPDLGIIVEADIQDGVGTSLMSWRSINSSVDYFQQYKTDSIKEWVNCSDSADCDVIVNHSRNGILTSGYLRLTHRQRQVNTKPSLRKVFMTDSAIISIRGCNTYGCGPEELVLVRTYFKVRSPSPLSGVTVARRENSAVLRWNPPVNGGYECIEVNWNCDGNKTIDRITRFHIDSTYNNTREALIKGLPNNVEECEFYVSAWNYRDERRYYSPPVRAVPE